MLGLGLPRQQVEGLLDSPRKPAEALTYGGEGRNRRDAPDWSGDRGFAGLLSLRNERGVIPARLKPESATGG